MWFVNLIHSAINYLNRRVEVVELQRLRIISSQEKKARSLLWPNNSQQSTAPSCGLLSDSEQTARNTLGPCPSPADSAKNNLKPRRSCSKISQPSFSNPKSPEWLPYLKMDLKQD